MAAAEPPDASGVVEGMRQQLSVITLGVSDLAAANRFYGGGFGWTPVFENDEIRFYQMNGFVLGTWLRDRLEADIGTGGASGRSPFALAHNVTGPDAVAALIDRLVAYGGTSLRAPDAPAHGGFRGYVADPDGHPWEIAHNPAWKIDPQGHVTFGL